MITGSAKTKNKVSTQATMLAVMLRKMVETSRAVPRTKSTPSHNTTTESTASTTRICPKGWPRTAATIRSRILPSTAATSRTPALIAYLVSRTRLLLTGLEGQDGAAAELARDRSHSEQGREREQDKEPAQVVEVADVPPGDVCRILARYFLHHSHDFLIRRNQEDEQYDRHCRDQKLPSSISPLFSDLHDPPFNKLCD